MKHILVTGAAHGIGRAIAEEFAKQQDTQIFVNARTAEKELMELAESICGIPLLYDLSKDREVEKMFREIAAYGDIDVLINNAGISHIGLLQDMTIEDWNRVIATNLTSVFSCCKRVIPAMVRKGEGRIVNISSVWGVAGASTEVAYSASKGGMNSFTKALAKELAPSRITVNGVACGVIDTRMNACFSEEERVQLKEEIPMGRFGTAQEVAKLVFDLTQHSYLTGQIVTLDGGYL